MKKWLIFVLLGVLVPISLNAQNISVASFKLLENDLTANTHGTMERDQNGEVAALIKIVTTEKGFVFDGGMVGITKVKQEVGEVWVYVPHGIKKVTIRHEQLGVLRDYFFPVAIEKARTYEMVLTTGRVETVVTHSANKQYVMFTVNPSNAIVELDGQPLTVNENGYVEKTMPYGTYSYRVYCANYHTEAGIVEVTAQNKAKVSVTLRPNYGWIDFTGAEELHGANIYIDNEHVGQLPLKSNALKSGAHQVKALKSLYKPYEQMVVVNDGETTSLDVKMLPNFANVTFKTDAESEIWIDGKLHGKGQTTVCLEMGKYTLHVKRESHRTVSDVILINEPGARTVQLPSPLPIYGVVDITSTPSEAIVYIDDVKVGETPLIKSDVLIGSRKITFEKDGYEPTEKVIDVAQGLENALSVTLEEKKSMYVGRGNSVYPSWISGVADRGLWLGVSPPTEDRVTARNLAIQNAVLCYLCANGGGEITFRCLQQVEERQCENEFSLESGSTEALRVVFDKFSVKVVDEYYNKRGEYFVACDLKQGKDTENALFITRTWTENEQANLQRETTLAGSVQCEVTSRIDGQEISASLEVTYGNEGVSYAMPSGEVVFADSHNWKYPNMQLDTMPEAYGYEYTAGQSLGVSQMACLILSPLVSDEVNVISVSYMQETESETFASIASEISAKGKVVGLGTTFYGVNKNKLNVAVKDNSAKMKSWDLDNRERFTVCDGASDTQNNRPLTLAKLNAYYGAMVCLASQKSSNEVSMNKSEVESLGRSMNKSIINCYSIDWGYQDLSEGSLVRVKVGIDEMEKQERLKEAMEESLRENPLNIPDDFSF